MSIVAWDTSDDAGHQPSHHYGEAMELEERSELRMSVGHVAAHEGASLDRPTPPPPTALHRSAVFLPFLYHSFYVNRRGVAAIGPESGPEEVGGKSGRK